MDDKPDLALLNDKIQKIKIILNEIQKESRYFPAISKNSQRALASIKMMELSICDLVKLNLS